MNTLAILIAYGKEEEIAPGVDAAFLTLGNAPMLVHALKTIQHSPVIDGIIVVPGKSRIDATLRLIKRYGFTKVCGVVVGSINRLSTLKTVFAKIPEPASMIVIQEATRPFVSAELIDNTVKAAKRYGCAIAAHKISDAVKLVPKGLKANDTLERNTAWAAQTPQAFKCDVFQQIIDTTAPNVKLLDDESAYVDKPSEIHVIESGPTNMKIRNSNDLAIATALWNAKLT